MTLRSRRFRQLLDRITPEDLPVAGASAQLICFACGTTLTAALASCGAIRCHDCRSNGAPLDESLLDLQRVLDGRRRSRG